MMHIYHFSDKRIVAKDLDSARKAYFACERSALTDHEKYLLIESMIENRALLEKLSNL